MTVSSDRDAVDAFVGPVDLDHLTLKLNTSVPLINGILDRLPHHPWSKPRVLEFFDDGLYRLLRLEKHSQQGGLQGEVLNSLRSPFGFQFAAWNSPYFFRIGLKKSFEKPFSKPIGYPLFEGVFLFVRKKLPLDVAENDQRAVTEAQT